MFRSSVAAGVFISLLKARGPIEPLRLPCCWLMHQQQAAAAGKMANFLSNDVSLVLPAATSTAAAATAAAGVSPAAAAAARELCSRQITAAKLLQQFDVFVFDCDGVLWHGSKVLPGIREMLQKLQQLPRSSTSSSSNSSSSRNSSNSNSSRKEKKTVYFVTNNSTLSRKGFIAKLNKLGISATEQQVKP